MNAPLGLVRVIALTLTLSHPMGEGTEKRLA